MVKGFVFFKEGKIPFVIENYRMELFTDDSLLNDFSKEYNFKANYILLGQYFGSGIQGQKASFFVERSMGSTCYLRCYIINMLTSEESRRRETSAQCGFLEYLLLPVPMA